MAGLLEKDKKGRWFFTRGKHAYEFLDDVAVSAPRYLQWLLDESSGYFGSNEAKNALKKVIEEK